MAALIRLIFTIALSALYLGQAVGQPLRASFWRDTISVATGSTFINRLTIQNNGSETVSFRLLVQTPRFVQWVSSTPQRFELKPGQTETVPFKGLLFQHTGVPTQQITVFLSDSTGHLLQTRSFKLTIAAQKNKPSFSLYVPDETVLLYSTTEPARPTFRLVHHQARRTSVSVDIESLSSGIDKAAFPLSIPLKALQDTSITLLVNPLRYWSPNKPHQLSLTLRDSTGSIVGSVLYKVVVAVASKRFEKANTGSSEGFGIRTAITKLSTNQWAREARIWGADSIGNAQLTFQLNYLDYASANYQQLQSSSISLRTSRTQLHVGSLYDYHELPLLGRGVRLNLIRPDHEWTFWAVNTNPNWLYSGANAWTGNVASVRYDQQIASVPGAAWSVSSSYFTQPGLMRAGYLNFASFQYDASENQSLQVLAGQSTEYAQSNPSLARTVGWAGQVHYSYERPALRWQLRSYFSTPVYSGLQRGATLLTSQLSWLPSDHTTLLFRINHVHYNQVRYVTATDNYRYVFGNSIVEASLTSRLGPLIAGFRPYWSLQTDSSNPFSQQATAYRVAPSLTYQRRHSQFMLTYDAGLFLYESPLPNRSQPISQRITTSASLGNFSLWGYFQKGPYFLNDLRTERPNQIMTASLTPMVNFSLLDKRLAGSAGLNYLYDALYLKSRYIAVGRVQYDVTPTFSVRLEGNGTPYAEQDEFTYSQYRLELTKRFDKLRFRPNGRLHLRFFSDANGNDRFDAGEQWLEGLLVTVNDNTLITDEKGQISYQNLPPGTYAVSALSTGRLGDPILFQESINMERSVNRVIPLRQTFRVTGQLSCQTNVYDQKPCEFERFVIEVQREGKKITSTTTLPDGTFALHLSPGTYTILVHDYGRQVQATVRTSALIVSSAGEHPALNWTVDGSTRAVEIKRFKQE
ncbi:hypothetical protein [Fibrella arboris]|uniref:hypothetical protein n=1 Tax=Fibrella arboris TaxID=3242486 RepID=UPI003520D00E